MAGCNYAESIQASEAHLLRHQMVSKLNENS